MKKVAFMNLVLLAATAVHAESLSPPFTVEMKSPLLIASPPANHHFNVDAPMRLKIDGTNDLKPVQATPKQVTFDVTELNEKNGGVMSLYLCDDAGKYCEKHEQKVAINEITTTESLAQNTASPQGAQERGSKLALKDHHGFYDNQPKLAFAEAAAKKRPMMIDFYGIWCPPCNELEAMVFSKPEFKKAAKNFVKLKVDVDAPATDELSVRYKIIGFPTVIFTDSKGEELSRFVGFRPLSDFVAEIKTDHSQHLPETADQRGLYYFNNGDFAQAIENLKDSKFYAEKYYEAQIALLDEKEKSGDHTAQVAARATRLAVLKAAIATFPNSPDTIDRLDSLAQLLEENKDTAGAKQARLDLIAHAKEIIEHPEYMRGYDCDIGGLWVEMAEAQEAIDDKAGAAKSWAQAIAQYQEKVKAGDVRGGNLELAYCLRKSNQVQEAYSLYEKMEQAYPGEFTFFFGHARALLALKKAKEALPLAEKALERSYGMNRLNSAELLAKIHKELNDKGKAKEVLKAALDSIPTPDLADPSGHESRLRKKMKELTQMEHELSAT